MARGGAVVGVARRPSTDARRASGARAFTDARAPAIICGLPLFFTSTVPHSTTPPERHRAPVVRRRPRRAIATSRRDAAIVAAVSGIRRLERALRLAARQVESVTRLSAAQLFVLEQLAGAPADSLNDLALRTLTDRSSVSALVDRLTDLGLVTRRSDRADRRRQRIRITATGRRVLASATRSPTALLIDGLRHLTRAELTGLVTGIARLDHAMALAAASARPLADGSAEGGGE
ncbi:MAG TPA: MarR family transcriptional regulator [Gemmatimonadaceae bacterium]|nr:MarR family transcriptional regulator [Gemmatimonadaceae bacterium]